jgi:hypothetical protein
LRRPRAFYKTGVVFMAWLNGHQSHFTMVGGQQSTRSLVHFAELFRLADAANLLEKPELAVQPHEDAAGPAWGGRLNPSMRDFSPDHHWLSINTATVRKSGGAELPLPDIIEACARRGIRAISPWRDQVAAAGLAKVSRLVKEPPAWRCRAIAVVACSPPPMPQACKPRT